MRIASRGMSGPLPLQWGQLLKSNLRSKLSLPLKLNGLLNVAVGVVLAAMLLNSHAAAQENPTGSITGKVSSASGAPIAGAKVTIINKTTGQTSTVQTDAAGSFTSPGLAVNDYELRVEAKGFISTTAS